MKKWFYFEGGVFLSLLVTISVYVSFPTRHVPLEEAIFLSFVPTFVTLLCVFMLSRAKNCLVRAMAFSIIVCTVYEILNLLGNFVSLVIPAIIFVFLGLIVSGFLASQETRLHPFGVLASFFLQNSLMVLFLIH